MSTPANAAEQTGSAGRPPTSLAVGLLRLARPKQWIKNFLVFVAPGAAGVLLHWSVLWHASAAFVIFSMAASGTYYLNDAFDVEADRAHPTKRNRPVASGAVPVPVAFAGGVGLLLAAVLLSWWLAGWHLSVVMATYAAINLAYSFGLKNEPIIDLAAVSAGFVLRAIAGGVATSVPLSNWFLIVASFGSLLIVTGKRSGEKKLLADEESAEGSTRATLGLYTPSFLQSVRTLAAAVTITGYCLWAFERAGQVHPGHDPLWFQLTIVPFSLMILHIMRLLDSGEGAAPEDLAIRDHRLQLYGLCLVALFSIGAYA